MSKSLNELLKWSILNQATAGEDASAHPEIKPMEKLDPGLIDHILGKSESQMMIEAMQVIKNPNANEHEKELAWEDFEMLIQQIDNASNIENMKLWPPILEELKNENATYREQAAWVCGTATQNNPKAQAAFLKENGLVTILDLLRSDSEKAVRAKALYALSGAIKHFDPAMDEFKKLDGYKTLVDILKETSDAPLLRKTVFLVNTLLLQDSEAAKLLRECELIIGLDRVLREFVEDEDLTEKTLVATKTFLQDKNSGVSPLDKAGFKTRVAEAKARYQDVIFSAADWTELEALVSN